MSSPATDELSVGDEPNGSPQNARMVRRGPLKEQRSPYDVACGARLRRTRIALRPDLSMARFAANTGTNPDNLGKWELGDAMVPQEYVQRLKEMFQVTHDWIYGGDPSSLPYALAQRILADQPE